MAKDLGVDGVAYAAKRQNVEPVVYLKVEFGGTVGTRYYGDKDQVVNSVQVEGRVVSMGALVQRVQDQGSGVTGDVSVELADPAMEIKGFLDSIDPTSVDVSVILTWEGATAQVTILGGRMGGAISWRAEDRIFRFDVVSGIVSREIGYKFKISEVSNLYEESEGVPLPFCMGSPVDVPAVLFKRGKITQLQRDLDVTDTSLRVLEGEGGSLFGTSSLTLQIGDGELVTGSFDATSGANENRFSITARNVKWYDVTTASRPGGDADVNNPWVLWIDDASKDCIGKFLRVAGSAVPGSGGSALAQINNFCVAQKGTKLWFEHPWTRLDFAGAGGNSWAWLVGSGVAATVKRFEWNWLQSAYNAQANYVHKAGGQVMDRNNRGYTYICNHTLVEEGAPPIDPTLQVYQVRARKKLQKNYAGLEDDVLAVVPTSYYTVTLSGTHPSVAEAARLRTTQIDFPTPLSRLGQGWSDEIYVTLQAGTGGGRNTATQLASLLSQYTNIEHDQVSFGAVAQQLLNNYPSDFAIAGRDALDACYDIAWQARLGLVVIGQTAYLHYLSEEPTEVVAGIGPTDRVAKSTSEEWSDRDDLRTIMIAKWKKRMSEREHRSFELEDNVAKYGAHSYEREFWIYRKRSLVEKSARFWLNRMSRMWRRYRCKTTLAPVILDALDACHFGDSPILPSGLAAPLVCRVEEVGYSSLPHALEFLLWSPVEVGTAVVSSAAYLDDSADTPPSDPTENMTSPGTETARVTPISFGMSMEPYGGGVPVEIVSGSGQNFVVDVYPDGYAAGAKQRLPMRSVNTNIDANNPSAPDRGQAAIGPYGGLVWQWFKT